MSNQKHSDPTPKGPAPGTRWRLLAGDGEERIELENRGVLDELVVDGWLHLEQMDDREWCLRVGDARLWVTIRPDGTQQVDVERGFYAAVDGETRTRG